MGTNYYCHGPACEHCGRSDPIQHIGKSSVGWVFALHVGDGVKSLDDWRAVWSRPGVVIRDESGRVISKEEMEKIILERSHPRGLLRRINNAGGGETYEFVTGEFS